ncbi:MAG: fasciclin domain-containing protein [Chloroflexota bacterium]
MRRLTSALLAGMLAVGIIAAPVAAAEPQKNIAEIAIANGNFKTLVTALSCTGLVPAVSGAGSLTVFAPTDSAFGKLGLNASNVCKLPKTLLTKILTYHVAGQELFAKDVLAASKIKMLNGLYTFPSVRNGNAYMNWYSKIVATDIDASNGVIHVIDRVLIPYRLW